MLPLRWLVVRGARTRPVFRFIGFIFKIRILLPALFLIPFPRFAKSFIGMNLLAEPTENASRVDEVLCDTLSLYFKFKGVFHLTFISN